MSDFKTLEQVAKEMEEERQKPRRPPQNAAEVNAAMIEYRRREREKLAKAQEQPKEGTEQPQGHPEELGLSYPDVKIPLINSEPAQAAAEAVVEQPDQSNGSGSKPDWNTTG